MSGWICLHRGMINWEWYDDANTMRLFIHCLIRANFKDQKWRGQDVKRGQFITSIDVLSSELKLSTSKIRTSIRKLEKTGEIASLSQARSRVITVLKYDDYQEDRKLMTAKPQDGDKVVTSSSQADRRLIATDNNVNNITMKKKEQNICKSRMKKSDDWKAFFENYPVGKKGGTDSTAWAKAKKLNLTLDDFFLMAEDVKNRSALCPTWRDKFALGITRYMDQKIWLTPIIPDQGRDGRVRNERDNQTLSSWRNSEPRAEVQHELFNGDVIDEQ